MENDKIQERFDAMWNHVIAEGCQPISAPLVRKICQSYINSIRGGTKTVVYFCENCKILHEHKQCPSCMNQDIVPEKDIEISLKEWAKF